LLKAITLYCADTERHLVIFNLKN